MYKKAGTGPVDVGLRETPVKTVRQILFCSNVTWMKNTAVPGQSLELPIESSGYWG